MEIMEINRSGHSDHIWKWRCPYMVSNAAWLSSSGQVWYCVQTKS